MTVKVTPCAGVWIEIVFEKGQNNAEGVTPCAGVWIEMCFPHCTTMWYNWSLPVRECGLK